MIRMQKAVAPVMALAITLLGAALVTAPTALADMPPTALHHAVSRDEQAIRVIDAAWSQALQNKDLDKVMSSYAEDASFLPPDEPIVVGKAHIRAWFARQITLPGFAATFSPTVVKVSRSHDLAYELGTFRVTINDESGKPVTHLGKHLVTWEKRDGRWKVAAESINRDSPATRSLRKTQ
ncbi:MAG TPA: DUF4440 domain-containing protein [Steroidobacteraceae bacterium]|nr:DUF4440 domain-containing protein [Steroidobacteraceae bacterium]